MATFGRDTPPIPNRQARSWPKRIERCCCGSLSYLPLVFVYGLTTWACWTGVKIGLHPQRASLNGTGTSVLIVVLYSLANISYTVAVFTSPGSPLDDRSAKTSQYSALPTTVQDAQHSSYSSFTAKSSGRPRYCKKCQATKPDRAHHCSSCGRCVLKMDHHCPWLATCVGLRNYKAFMLFLSYVSLFCWACFMVAAEWTWLSFEDVDNFEAGAMTVHIILLAVLGGIFGLVLTGFTAWHFYLASRNQTTIECLEKTRYLSPLKRNMEQQLERASLRRDSNAALTEPHSEPLLEQLKELHANTLPGILRPEEGLVSREGSNASPMPPHPQPAVPQVDGAGSSPARDALRTNLGPNFAEQEAQRERDRYELYLDDRDSERLPHAFDLGWRRNLRHLFGERWWLWGLPVCNTSGDGWSWEVSETWIRKRDEVARQRAAENGQGRLQHHGTPSFSGAGAGGAGRWYRDMPAPRPVPLHAQQSMLPSTTSQGIQQGTGAGGARGSSGGVQMQDLGRDSSGDGDEYDTSSDEEPSGKWRTRASPAGSGRQLLQTSGRRKGD